MSYQRRQDAVPELEAARAKIEELRAAVESERRLRQKAETASRTLARELAEEREGREALERLGGELEEAERRERETAEAAAREAEEERRTMRANELMREERVRMKLSEARLTMEEELDELIARGGCKH